ncbi:hypothetical protein H3C65_02070 [Patescibacteria group bacterium]|nr:hypothetical protein [Patescibacteria group bacterium]
MPETTPEIKATTFNPEQVFEFGKEGVTASGVLIKSLQEIREKDQSGEGAKKALERMKIGDKESARLSQADIEKISKLEWIDQTVREVMQKEARNLDIFCEVSLRSQRENVSKDVILAEIRKSGKWQEVPSLSEINKSVLKALREIGVVRNTVSGAKDIVNEAIVTKILSTPDNIEAFRKIYTQSLKAALERVDTLKPLKEVEGKKQKEEERDDLQRKTDNHVRYLKTITELDESEIRNLFDEDLDQAQIVEQLFERTLNKQGVQGVNIPVIKEAIKTEVRIALIGEEMKSIQDSINQIDEELSAAESTPATNRKAGGENAEIIKAIEQRKFREELKQKNKQQTLDRLNKEIMKSREDMKDKILKYKDLYKKIYGQETTGGEEQIRATAVAPARIQKLVEQLPQLKQKIREIKALEDADKDYQKELKQRKFEEEDILRQLRVVLNDSMVDFLVQRIDQMSALDVRRQTKEQDEKLNKFDKDLDKRYIEFDGKQEKHYRTKIREDIDSILKYGKEEGELVITAKILGGYDDDPSRWTEEQRNEIKKVHSQKGDSIRANLFKSFYKSRLLGERSWIKLGMPFSKKILFEGTIGTLALTDAQFSKLAEQYSSEMETGLKASKQAQEVLKGLKEKGVNPNINLKWLLWILVILGIIGGGVFLASR